MLRVYEHVMAFRGRKGMPVPCFCRWMPRVSLTIPRDPVTYSRNPWGCRTQHGPATRIRSSNTQKLYRAEQVSSQFFDQLNPAMDSITTPNFLKSQSFWNISEVVHMTLQHADEPTLASCARVNKTLSKHALDLLYHECFDFIQVLTLLCPVELRQDGITLDFVEALEPSHWARFERYRSRIRSLIVDIRPQALSSGSIAELLATAPRGQAIFPSLTSLQWNEMEYDDTQLVISLFHEKIKFASLTVTGHAAPNWLVLDRLIRQSPHLRTLHYWNLEESESSPKPSESILQAFESLKFLWAALLSPKLVTPEMMKVLSRKPDLKVLWTSFLGPDQSHHLLPKPPTITSSGAFSCLADISIDSALLLETPDILNAGPQLTSLHIELLGMDRTHSLLSLVSKRCTNLRSLSVIFEKDVEPPTPFTMDTIEPILVLKALETLVIESSTPPVLSDQDIEKITISFPGIRHIEICPRAIGLMHGPCPTLACLVSLAKNCRKLISFGIYLNAASIPHHTPLIQDQYTFPSGFRTMHVLCSTIADSYMVADYLASRFPANAKVSLSRYSQQLRSVSHPIDILYSPVESDKGMDHTSILFRDKWQKTSRILAILRYTREVLASQRKENETLRKQFGSVGH
ncbi:hypothetical protein SISSUDRAFT_698701 [Sistotremastrum suecicum HHB10207 ss-3]|uniref:F-box domain-containing protein n=1 Tax=Sistotremastrum suecicum HHB10207 ss-3 TaxID=1314776 RepID=A0A166DYC7_9AGAM|nr:hypothetical protein SISSUDRAFT_698701 [Sistotremastrum suecicum HHB10207 ss-3]